MAPSTVIAVSVSSAVIGILAFIFILWKFARRRKNAAKANQNAFDVLKFYKNVTMAADEAHYRNISRNRSISSSGRNLDGTTDVGSVNGSRRGSMFSKTWTADQPLQTDKSRRESIRTAFFDVTPNQGSGENTPSGYDSPFNRSRRQSIQPMLGNQHHLNENAADPHSAFSQALRFAGEVVQKQSKPNASLFMR